MDGILHTAMTPSELATSQLPIMAVWPETFASYEDAYRCGDENDPDKKWDGWFVLVAAAVSAGHVITAR